MLTHFTAEKFSGINYVLWLVFVILGWFVLGNGLSYILEDSTTTIGEIILYTVNLFPFVAWGFLSFKRFRALNYGAKLIIPFLVGVTLLLFVSHSAAGFVLVLLIAFVTLFLTFKKGLPDVHTKLNKTGTDSSILPIVKKVFIVTILLAVTFSLLAIFFTKQEQNTTSIPEVPRI